MNPAPVFNEVLEAAGTLSVQQQEDLLQILKSRMIDQKRDALEQAVHEARAEYARGEVKQGSVADLMKDLEK
mgnify:CR=1 FL=1